MFCLVKILLKQHDKSISQSEHIKTKHFFIILFQTYEKDIYSTFELHAVSAEYVVPFECHSFLHCPKKNQKSLGLLQRTSWQPAKKGLQDLFDSLAH